MASIHVDTDMLRQLGAHFQSLNNQIQNDIGSQISNLTSQLDSTWQGQSHNHFTNLYQDWKSRAAGIVQSGEDLGRHLQNTATQFDNADQS